MTNSAVQFLRLPVLASSGLAVVASGLLYFKQKCAARNSPHETSKTDKIQVN